MDKIGTSKGQTGRGSTAHAPAKQQPTLQHLSVLLCLQHEQVAVTASDVLSHPGENKYDLKQEVAWIDGNYFAEVT